MYKEAVAVDVTDWSNRSIKSCEELNRYDSHWLWGRSGEGWEGFRDWKDFTYVDLITRQIETNDWIHEVIEWRGKDSNWKRRHGVGMFYSVCCVRGLPSN